MTIKELKKRIAGLPNDYTFGFDNILDLIMEEVKEFNNPELIRRFAEEVEEIIQHRISILNHTN